MNLYLDSSVVVSLHVSDALAARAEAYLIAQMPALILSDFASAEFVSAVGRRVRTKELTVRQARSAFANFDIWASRATVRVETAGSDIKAADAVLRRLDLTLRAPDAINIAIAQRVGAVFATFDEKQAACARKLGLTVAAI